jgi:hypothetical protein
MINIPTKFLEDRSKDITLQQVLFSKSEQLNEHDDKKDTLILNFCCHSSVLLGHRTILNLDKYNLTYNHPYGSGYTVHTNNNYHNGPCLIKDGKEYRSIELNKQIFEDNNESYTDQDLKNLLTNEHVNCGKYCIRYSN